VDIPTIGEKKDPKRLKDALEARINEWVEDAAGEAHAIAVTYTPDGNLVGVTVTQDIAPLAIASMLLRTAGALIDRAAASSPEAQA